MTKFPIHPLDCEPKEMSP